MRRLKWCPPLVQISWKARSPHVLLQQKPQVEQLTEETKITPPQDAQGLVMDQSDAALDSSDGGSALDIPGSDPEVTSLEGQDGGSDSEVAFDPMQEAPANN